MFDRLISRACFPAECGFSPIGRYGASEFRPIRILLVPCPAASRLPSMGSKPLETGPVLE